MTNGERILKASKNVSCASFILIDSVESKTIKRTDMKKVLDFLQEATNQIKTTLGLTD